MGCVCCKTWKSEENQILTCDSLIESIQKFSDNPDLSCLVQKYLDNSQCTLNFFKELDQWLIKAMETSGKYKKAFDERSRLNDLDSPFTAKLYKTRESVQSQHVKMLKDLESKTKELDKKLRKLKFWRKLLGVILVLSVAAILICSVVTAAMVAPPIAAALSAVASLPLGTIGNWVIDSLLKDYENELKWQLNRINKIRSRINNVKNEIESLMCKAELDLRNDESVIFFIMEIRSRIKVLTRRIENDGRSLQTMYTSS